MTWRAHRLGTALGALLLAGSAGADETTTLTRAAPWHAVKEGDLTRSPPVVAHSEAAADSPLEAALKARVGVALGKVAAAPGGRFQERPAKDLLRTVLATIAQDQAALNRCGDISGAVIRASLTYAVADVLPATGACTGSERVDAVYEGLAMSAALSRLPFPEQTHTATRECAKVARAAQRAVDAATTEKLLSPEAAGALKRAAGTDAASRRADASDAKLHAELSALGLDDLDVKALSGELEQGLPPCAGEAACAARAFVLQSLGNRRGASKPELVAAARLLAAHLGLTATAGSLERDLFDALPEAIVDDKRQATIDESAIARRLAARYGLGVDGPPRASALVGLPPEWTLDFNAGVPAFVDYIRLVGDASVGYRGKNAGVRTTMGVQYYDLQTTGIITDNLHAWGGLEGSYVTGEREQKLRWQLRGSTGVDYYDTTTIEANTSRGQKFRFGDYDSLLLVAVVEFGALWKPTDRVSVDARIGGGAQHESYDTTSLDANGLNFTSPETLSARGTGSVTTAWHFWPRRLGARFRGGGSIFRLTRETVSFSASSNGSTREALSSTTETQMQLQGRGYLDVDALRFSGFLPAAWVGADVVAAAGASTFVPATGVAVVHD